MNIDKSRGHFEIFAGARLRIGPLAVDLDRRIGRGHLFNMAHKGGQGRFDFGLIGACIAGFNHFAIRIICGGARAPMNRERIAFRAVGHIGHGLGGFAERDGQNAGRRRVERSRMTELCRASRATDRIHTG